MRQALLIACAAVIIILLVITQHSFIHGLGPSFRFVQLPLFAALFIAAVFNRQLAFAVFFSFTLVESLLASQWLLLPIAVSLLVCAVMTELHERIFTNRTFYAVFAMGLVGWIMHQSLTYTSAAFAQALFFDTGASVAFPAAWPATVGFAALLSFFAVAYASMVMVSKRMRSYFILGSDQPSSYAR